MDPKKFNHANRELILEWADAIDNSLLIEMNRENDLGIMDKHPATLLDIDELLIAARLSKYATHVYVGDHDIIASNFGCVYLSWFPA